ncbi:MAG: SpoIID/LytB domain-containing protein [Cyanobacteriota bacterium]|nr:SpoIID/LytB domain-containing protein [Cyanobacteriota bacterium]
MLPALVAVIAVLLPAGCRAADGPQAPLPPPAPPLHWPVPAPAAIDPARPVLWVALAAHLGAAEAKAPAAPLRLRAAAGLLQLRDAAGHTASAPELLIDWHWQPLERPLHLQRRVLGPYASFESAEQAAERWRAAGVAAVIARPRDWEVWAPLGSPDPAGSSGRDLDRQVTGRAVPVWRSTQGPLTLKGPVTLEAAGGLRWVNGVHGGPFRLQSNAHGGWTLVEQVPLERYLEGVVPHEIGAGSPPAALAAQAVLARTWALRNSHRFMVDGYHLCSDTQCQVYSDPRQAGSAVRQAIAATRLQVLTWNNQPIHAVYHASNGGVSAGFDEVWSGAPLPYLQPAIDGPAALVARFPLPLAPGSLAALLADGRQAYGSNHPRFRWQRLLAADRLQQALGTDGARIGRPTGLRVLERGPSGRVLALEIQGASGVMVLRRDAIRRSLRELPSTLFSVTSVAAGRWRIDGGGFGHGAGLSQAGAISLAAQGWSSERILSHYYPGTRLQVLGANGQAP